jgi:hypothetical protein
MTFELQSITAARLRDSEVRAKLCNSRVRQERPQRRLIEHNSPAPEIEVTDYSSLLELLRQRADDLEISRSTIDHISGLQEGYSAKVLSLTKLRRIGAESLGPLLDALCLKLIAVPDDEAFARNRSRLVKRDDAHYRSARQGHDLKPRPRKPPKPKPPGKWPFKRMRGTCGARLFGWPSP